MKRYIHTADAVFALILFCAFAVSMLMVLTTGAQAYQNVRSGVENHYSEDTCISYIVMKLRHYDDSSYSAEIGEIEGGISALLLTETIFDSEYTTAIYFHDGYVKELYAESGYAFNADDGFEIVEAQELEFTMLENGLYRVSCTGIGGSVAQCTVSLRDGGEQ